LAYFGGYTSLRSLEVNLYLPHVEPKFSKDCAIIKKGSKSLELNEKRISSNSLYESVLLLLQDSLSSSKFEACAILILKL